MNKIKVKWVWKCRDCGHEVEEANEEDLQHSTNPSGFPLKFCSKCGGVVDLCGEEL